MCLDKAVQSFAICKNSIRPPNILTWTLEELSNALTFVLMVIKISCKLFSEVIFRRLESIYFSYQIYR